ncbi:MAG: PspA/IM30 family protein [Gammaproteobacteria bacterium]
MANIFKRINDVITANLNDLIDRVEDPERMIKQIIREMEDNISRARDSVVDAIANEKQLLKELENNQKLSAEWLSKAEAALQNNNEDLARAALARKKEHDTICKALEPSWQSAKNTSENLKAQLKALEAKLEEARRKRSSLAARQHAAEARQQMDRTLSHFDAGIRSQTQFERMEDRVASMEARTEAMMELRDDRSQLEKEFLDMELNAEIDQELLNLKAKISEKDANIE